MGLYDKGFGTQSQVQQYFTPAEAFAAILLGAIASDGYFSVEQADTTSSILSRMKLFKGYSQDMINGMFEKLLDILRQDGINTLFNIARESLPQDLREAVFATVSDLVLADSVFIEEEQDFLKDLYQALGLATDMGRQIMEVMLIKNRG